MYYSLLIYRVNEEFIDRLNIKKLYTLKKKSDLIPIDFQNIGVYLEKVLKKIINFWPVEPNRETYQKGFRLYPCRQANFSTNYKRVEKKPRPYQHFVWPYCTKDGNSGKSLSLDEINFGKLILHWLVAKPGRWALGPMGKKTEVDTVGHDPAGL